MSLFRTTPTGALATLGPLADGCFTLVEPAETCGYTGFSRNLPRARRQAGDLPHVSTFCLSWARAGCTIAVRSPNTILPIREARHVENADGPATTQGLQVVENP